MEKTVNKLSPEEGAKFKILDDAVLALLNPETEVSNEFLIQHTKATNQEVAHSLNRLLKLDKILISNCDNVIHCKLKQEMSYAGLDVLEEKLVYDAIGAAGTNGIWIRDIRNKTNLVMPHLSKILKTLENKRKIKSVKSVMAARKKVYMLYELTPDTKVTGDLFYSDQQEFDIEFTEVMFKASIKCLELKLKQAEALKCGPLMFRDECFATVHEILKYIEDSKLFTVKIGIKDMAKVLKSLTFSGKIESSTKYDQELKEDVACFRIVAPLVSKPSLVCMPCGACPVQLQCSDTGAITPSKCQYLAEWLDMGLPENAGAAVATHN